MAKEIVIPQTNRARNNVLKKYGPTIQRRFIKFWNNFEENQITLGRVSKWKKTLGIDELFELQFAGEYDNFIKSEIIPVFADMIKYAGERSMIQLINALRKKQAPFNNVTQRIVEYIEREGAFLIRADTTNQINMIRNILILSMEYQYNVQETIAMIKGAIGLSGLQDGWVGAVKRFYRETFERYRKTYIARGRPALEAERLARGKALKWAQKYKERLRIKRAKRIARTEANRAYQFGQQESYRQAIQSGLIRGAQREWVRTNFTDNWESSIINDGSIVGIDDNFPSGDPFPNEIHEQCILRYLVTP